MSELLAAHLNQAFMVATKADFVLVGQALVQNHIQRVGLTDPLSLRALKIGSRHPAACGFRTCALSKVCLLSEPWMLRTRQPDSPVNSTPKFACL